MPLRSLRGHGVALANMQWLGRIQLIAIIQSDRLAIDSPDLAQVPVPQVCATVVGRQYLEQSAEASQGLGCPERSPRRTKGFYRPRRPEELACPLNLPPYQRPPPSLTFPTVLAVGASITGSRPVKLRIAVAASLMVEVLPTPALPSIPVKRSQERST